LELNQVDFLNSDLLSEENADEHHGKMAILFIAFLISEAKRIIQKRYSDFKLVFSVNLGAPLENLNDNETSNLYSELLRIAWRTANQHVYPIEQGMGMKSVNDLFTGIQNYPSQYIQENEDQFLFIVPECHGAMMSFISNVHLPRPITYFLVIDIGAYTTDVALFNTGQVNRRISYFATGVIRKGMLQYEQSIDKNEYINHLRISICDICNRPFNNGILTYNLIQDNLEVSIIGGGSLNENLCVKLLDRMKFMPRINWNKYYIRDEIRESVFNISDNINETTAKSEIIFLLVALGLSTDFLNIEECVVPRDIPPLAVIPPEPNLGGFDTIATQDDLPGH
jgi:hypothetical protein